VGSFPEVGSGLGSSLTNLGLYSFEGSAGASGRRRPPLLTSSTAMINSIRVTMRSISPSFRAIWPLVQAVQHRCP
jgi:hypothetical protein